MGLFNNAGRELGHAANLSGAHANEVANAQPNRLDGGSVVKVRDREDCATFGYQFRIFERRHQVVEVDELPFRRHDGSGFFHRSVLLPFKVALVGECANDSVPLPGLGEIPSLVTIVAMVRRHFSAVG